MTSDDDPGRFPSAGASCGGPEELDADIEMALATWPQIEPDVERIVTRVCKATRYFDNAMQASLHQVGLTKEECKVLLRLHRGPRSHGTLCRELGVSTGAMTNRLDKLERAGFVRRQRDPHDRRGVVLELAPGGRSKLDEYIDTGAGRERELLAGLSADDKRQLAELLRRLVAQLAAGGEPAARVSAA